VVSNARLRRDPPGSLKFDLMSLAVMERERIDLEAQRLRDRQGGR
jgi:hypothetical protein